ncbi:MAG: IPT/TIG domain-containing protein, partial [Bacteroidota bacterium]
QEIQKITGRGATELRSFPEPSNSDPVPLATPIITGLSPTTLPAGTYSLLTISGSDFGSTPGSVDFPNADTGGSTLVTADATLIQSWSDNEITIFVPTRATTGNIEVSNSTAETGVSSITLNVHYNVTGLINNFIQQADYTPDLINSNGAGGYTYTFNEDYFTN